MIAETIKQTASITEKLVALKSSFSNQKLNISSINQKKLMVYLLPTNNCLELG